MTADPLLISKLFRLAIHRKRSDPRPLKGVKPALVKVLLAIT